MKFKEIYICFALVFSPFSAGAQDMFGGMLMGMGQQALERGEEAIDSASQRIGRFLNSGQPPQAFGSEQECLGKLQVVVNSASVLAKIMPFSSVATLEDDRGPVGQMRLVLNGEKIYAEAYCDGAVMLVKPLPWGSGVMEPRHKEQTTFDAAAGLLLLMKLQGAFEPVESDTSAAEITENADSQFELSSHWERAEGKASAGVYSIGSELLDRAHLSITCFDSYGSDPTVGVFLQKRGTLFKQADKMQLGTKQSKVMVNQAVAAEIKKNQASIFDSGSVSSFLSKLSQNDADTFALTIETFEAPLVITFPMDGFGDALKPVAAYCPDAFAEHNNP